MLSKEEEREIRYPLGDDLDIEVFECEVPMDEYIQTCVDVPQFLSYCKECKNYNRIWSCPSFSFDPADYLSAYQSILIVGYKVNVPKDRRLRVYTEEEQGMMTQTMLSEPKRKLDKDMLEREAATPGSMALSGGSCLYCTPGDCARISGSPCRYPEKMRYSIEALGGNVGLTVTKYLHQQLEWIEKGRMPGHFILVAGLLLP